MHNSARRRVVSMSLRAPCSLECQTRAMRMQGGGGLVLGELTPLYSECGGTPR